jgi:hypothetical protein
MRRLLPTSLLTATSTSTSTSPSISRLLLCAYLLLVSISLTGCVNWPLACTSDKEVLDYIKTSTSYFYYCRAIPQPPVSADKEAAAADVERIPDDSGHDSGH